jgi:hypothetical protein
LQFPFSAPIYFCYVAPLLGLAMFALIGSRERQSYFIHGSLLVFYMAFAALQTTPGFILKLGFTPGPDEQTFPLQLPRAGNLRVYSWSGAQYEALIPFVQRHARGEYNYATPDCPEVYFLSGLRNPTRTLFDCFDDPAGRTQRIMDAIDFHQVNEVVLLKTPEFSLPVSPDLRQQLGLRFPHSRNAGPFEVRWRE